MYIVYDSNKRLPTQKHNKTETKRLNNAQITSFFVIENTEHLRNGIYSTPGMSEPC